MKNQKGFIVPLLILIVAIAVAGAGIYVYTQNKKVSEIPVSVITGTTTTTTTTPVSTSRQASVSQTSSSSPVKKTGPLMVDSRPTNSSAGASAIVIKDFGSTNTGAFTITISSDGGGTKNFQGDRNTAPSLTQYPAGTFDYKGLVADISQVPSLQFTNNFCAKSASFGTTETLTYQGVTSGDVTCMPSAQYNNLSQGIQKAENTAECFDPSNTSGLCQDFNAEQTATIDSGIVARVSVSPIPGCQQTVAEKQQGFNPCGTGPYQATFSISKSDGTFIENISTDKNDQFTVDLSPGNYIITDVNAGTSNMAHAFFNANAEYNGTLGNASDGKISYSISIPAHVFVPFAPWFDGISF